MKAASLIALSFACLVLLLDVDASPARPSPVPAASLPSAAGHVGEGGNRPL